MANQTVHPDDQTVITSQPMPGESDTLATFPDGWAECVLTGYVKKQILATPGFPCPIERTKEPVFHISSTPDRGLGMFAVKRMKMGDLVLDERPMMVTPALANPSNITFPESFTEKEVYQAAIYEYEKTLRFCFRRMPKENQQAFMGLSNCHQHDGSGILFGIIRTNGYRIEELKDNNAQESFGIYTAVWDKLSRLNHSCSPNICRKWNMASFSMQIRAARDIEEGEELTTAYCGILDPAATRQTDLAPYDFKCRCAACLDPSKSDVRRGGFSRSPVLIPPFIGKGKGKGDWLDPALKLLAEMEEEGVQASLFYKTTLQQLVHACIYMGDKDRVLLYGRKLDAISRARGDSMDPSFTSLKKLKRLSQWGMGRRQAGQQVYR
ncbi:SET domain-containing protein [Guyanagaster necrorhizus]|uniref:SET domain-containing protein n=1 Tax=Guyanagaster necrorhizus TaxID=856835 RepID=A0A9P7VMK0_9AGAR|nr:SET domain-containing protein [Guyanagaster necrorhizus MCA 3950]KAG7443372.1 SET domain-containing protein [Guyanagaster necrorhizus MCA 3950]